MITTYFHKKNLALWFTNWGKNQVNPIVESFLSLFRHNQELVLGTIRKPLKLEISFLCENRSEIHLQYDAVKNYYEQGNHKAPF